MEHPSEFSPPTADMYTPPESYTQTNLMEGAIAELKRTGPWTTFLAVLGCIATGIMFLVGILSITTGGTASMNGSPILAGFGLGIGMLYFVIGFIYFLPVYFLLKYSRSIRQLSKGNLGTNFAEALRHQRRFWKTIGIFVLIYIFAILAVIMIPSFSALFALF